MKQTVNEYDFTEAFRRMGRMVTTENKGGNFTYSALQAMFEYLEQFEEDTGEEMELDPVAICCDFGEYQSAQEAALEYSWTPDADNDKEENEKSALEYLQDQTTVIEFDGGVIVQGF